MIKSKPNRRNVMMIKKDDHGMTFWNKYDWWRHLEEMKSAFGRKVFEGRRQDFGGKMASAFTNTILDKRSLKKKIMMMMLIFNNDE